MFNVPQMFSDPELNTVWSPNDFRSREDDGEALGLWFKMKDVSPHARARIEPAVNPARVTGFEVGPMRLKRYPGYLVLPKEMGSGG